MPSTTFSAIAKQLSTPSQPALRPVTPLPSLSQSTHVRYELCSRTGKLMTLYRDGYSVTGYDTINQFYADMSTEGWQVKSTQQARSCSLHFAVLTRSL